jgi:hypothetical protein
MSQSESERWLAILRATLDATADGIRRHRHGPLGPHRGLERRRRKAVRLLQGSNAVEDETIVVPHSDDYGRTVAVIFVHRDATEKRRLEERLQQLEAGKPPPRLVPVRKLLRIRGRRCAVRVSPREGT